VGQIRASVIVPVRNDRGQHLAALLEALSKQTIPRESFEIVIGDDGSTDGSTDGLATVDGWVRVVRGPARNSYAGRNRAVRAAKGRILAFCDSDCVPEPDWLERGIARLESEAGDVVAAGAIRFLVPERRTVWTLADMDSTKNHEREVEIGNAETANLFVSRKLFDRLGGFDETIPEHGDFDFARRSLAAGAQLVYAPDALVWHPTRDDRKAFLKMVWVMHRWYAAREARAGRRPLGLKFRWWIPVAPHAFWRKRSGRSLALDRRWLSENGVCPTWRDNLKALPVLYFVMPYYGGAAQLRGWRDGRALRRASSPPHPTPDLDLAGPTS